MCVQFTAEERSHFDYIPYPVAVQLLQQAADSLQVDSFDIEWLCRGLNDVSKIKSCSRRKYCSTNSTGNLLKKSCAIVMKLKNL